MAHYFSNQENVKSNPKQIAFRTKNDSIKLMTDHGIFNKGYVDLGTQTLLSTVDFKTHHKMLDLGCGSGVIGIYALKQINLSVDFVDINERAVALTKKNLKLMETVGFERACDKIMYERDIQREQRSLRLCRYSLPPAKTSGFWESSMAQARFGLSQVM